jgi:BirA family transcriptional regulator, biotin operon repressor / biotin---[acetyl-CoA-carboxylase] ligase
MRRPDEHSPWLELEEVASTQDVATDHLRSGREVPGLVIARRQTQGRGRFGRTWQSTEGESLTVSLVMNAYADHPKPYLLGMAIAAAVAGALHLRLRWPNDLHLSGKKVGGVLTEIVTAADGTKVPVVGLGLNLNQPSMPDELKEMATSLMIERETRLEPEEVLRTILRRVELIPEPNAWSDLAPVWALFDDTRGKLYRLDTGEEAVALGVGPEGELLCAVDGESRSVLAADALL